MKQNAVERKARTNASSASLLAGLIYDDQDRRLIPHHANKKGRKYRYYVSAPNLENTIPPIRLPAREIEAAVISSLAAFLTNGSKLIDALNSVPMDPGQMVGLLDRARDLSRHIAAGQLNNSHNLIRALISKVIIAPGMLCIQIVPAMLAKELGVEMQHREAAYFTLDVPITCKRRGVESRFVIDGELGRPASPDPKLITQIVQAHDLFEQITEGKVASVAEYARLHGMDQGDARRLLPLAFLAPDIVEAIIDGRQPVDLSVSRLKRVNGLPLSWGDQRAFLGFASIR